MCETDAQHCSKKCGDEASTDCLITRLAYYCTIIVSVVEWDREPEVAVAVKV